MDDAFRAAQESAITNRLTRVFSSQRKRLVRGGPDAGWDQFAEEFRDAVADRLRETYEESAMLALLLMLATSPDALRSLQERPVEFDGTKYAEKRAKELSKAIRERMEDAAKQAKQDATDAGSALRPGDLSDDLGPINAESIAITETTAAGTAGEVDARKKADQRFDITVTAYWVTEKDGRVCAICSPLDEQPESAWGEKLRDGPPAHPRCRCKLTYR